MGALSLARTDNAPQLMLHTAHRPGNTSPQTLGARGSANTAAVEPTGELMGSGMPSHQQAGEIVKIIVGTAPRVADAAGHVEAE